MAASVPEAPTTPQGEKIDVPSLMVLESRLAADNYRGESHYSIFDEPHVRACRHASRVPEGHSLPWRIVVTRNHIRRHVTTNALRPKTGSVRPFGPAIAAAWLLALGIALAPREAGAFDLHGGVSLGGVLAGTVPRFAISPHLGVGWRTESGLFFEAHDMASILPLGNLGIYNQTSAALGYASDKASFSAGPTLAIYSMPACGAVLCGSVAGFSPGGHAAASYYVAGPFGVAVHVHAAWIGGNSLVLPGGVAVMAVLGPVVRWRSE